MNLNNGNGNGIDCQAKNDQLAALREDVSAASSDSSFSCYLSFVAPRNYKITTSFPLLASNDFNYSANGAGGGNDNSIDNNSNNDDAQWLTPVLTLLKIWFRL